MSTPTIRIDFVSDISCPWCAVGLSALEQAVQRVAPAVSVDLHFQPFELNPHMGPDGQDIGEHLTQKYGSTPEQQAQIRDNIRLRGQEVGFTFRMAGRDRIYNTFDAHRLLHWADIEGAAGQQHALKKALLKACHTDGQSPASHEVLVQAAAGVGLDAARAQGILASDEFADAVRAQAQRYLGAGIHSVPAIILNQQHLISGGQPVEIFERALRQLAASA
jgi:predicted DsbA family dithiol-disulfide isomerase